MADPAGRRALIVGCGRIAGGFNEADESAVLTHVVAYRRSGAAVVGCVDADAAAASRFAARWGIGAAGVDLARVLDHTQPDVVSLCTPPSVRLDALRAILACPSVRAVLVEKPLATTASEASAIHDLVSASGRAVIVNYFRAFDPFYGRLEAACRTEEWGALRVGTALYYGEAHTNASHLMERLLAMFGPAASRRTGGDAARPHFEMSWAGGTVTFLPSTGCRFSPIELDLLFESGRLRVVDSERRAELFAAVPDPQYPGYFTLAPQPLGEPDAPTAESILGAVRSTLLAADEGPREADRALLRRALDVARLLDSIEARGA